jgi:hypothetical protein
VAYLVAAFFLVIGPFVFPDGRFVQRWTGLLTIAAVSTVLVTEDEVPMLALQQPALSPAAARTPRLDLPGDQLGGTGARGCTPRYR